MDKNVVDFPMSESEKTLLNNINSYLKLKPENEATIDELCNFFKVKPETIERIMHLTEGRVISYLDEAIEKSIEQEQENNQVEVIVEESEEEESEEQEVIEKEQRNRNFLQELALDKISYEDAVQAHVENRTIDKLKLFQIQVAKNELTRMVKMIDLFNTMQEEYMNRVQVSYQDMGTDEIIYHNKLINQFLEQSMKIVDKFTQDENLQIIMMDNGIDEVAQNLREASTAEDVLLDKSKRKQVRKSAQRLINWLSDVTSEEKQDDGTNTAKEAEIVAEPTTESDNVKETQDTKEEVTETPQLNMDDDTPVFEMFKKLEEEHKQ